MFSQYKRKSSDKSKQDNLENQNSNFAQWEEIHFFQRKLRKNEDPDGKVYLEKRRPFSILKDAQGNYYKIDNDHTVTKSKEAFGAQGKYRRLYPLKQANQRANDIPMGVKIELVRETKTTALPVKREDVLSFFDLSPSASDQLSSNFHSSSSVSTSSNIEDEIFGKKSPVRNDKHYNKGI